MKIGIITFHRAINYGGVLQAFALQKIISNEGYDCEIIDYYCPFIEEHYRTKKYFTVLQIKRFVSTILYNGELKRNVKGFEEFSSKYLRVSDTKYNFDNLVKTNEIYDRFITGSDQVWSPTCAGFDPGYFLTFVEDNSKKISYAASFGTKEIPTSKVEEYTRRIEHFEAISVREKSGTRIVQKLSGREAELVLDPTLLLNREQWATFFSDECKVRENYILVYMISEDNQILKAAKEVAQRTNRDVIYINDRIYKAKGVENIRKISPDKWVQLFLNAEMIFTNSFHGIAFSINFNKDFYAYHLQGNNVANERIDNIINMFALNERLNKKDIHTNRSIGYKDINEQLELLRKNSIEFLRRNLE